VNQRTLFTVLLILAWFHFFKASAAEVFSRTNLFSNFNQFKFRKFENQHLVSISKVFGMATMSFT
jgi:hypothetical protein